MVEVCRLPTDVDGLISITPVASRLKESEALNGLMDGNRYWPLIASLGSEG
jgi:hypothetical protein